MASVVGSITNRSSSLLWNRISSIPAQYPFAFGVVFSGLKTSFSDLLVQKVVERRDEIDWRRNAAFATFGFVYLGGVQYAIYVPLFGRLFSSARSFVAKPWREKIRDYQGMLQTLGQVALDQCVHHPFLYFPAFYVTKEMVMAKNPDVGRCLQEYFTKNIKEDLLALWKVWVPCTLVNFAFMPFHLRIPFTAGVSLVWTCILSMMRGGDVAHATDLAGGAVTGATLHILEEGLDALFTEPVPLESNKAHVVLTASGRDKLGWVALLASTVAEAGGSITESKMVRLGNDFIILMHISVAPEKQRDLAEYLQQQDHLTPLNIRMIPITRRGTGTFQAALTGVRIRCQGPDQPGMLASIARALNDAGLNIENVTTEIVRSNKRKHTVNVSSTSSNSDSNATSSSKSYEYDFVCTAEAVAVHYMDYERIQTMVKELEKLKETLHLNSVDVRVQRVKPDDEINVAKVCNEQ